MFSLTGMRTWNVVRLSTAQKRRLIECLMLGVPVYRQRFQPVCSAATVEKFYRPLRLLRLCRALA
ncbi:hypothetical protein [Fulvimonas soli]|jgi:hypothetical protein|uniref:hypothetical protein n=1 Tax=Fulvimonas soli TaxID=155197 RepID=UPI0011212C15|nr:hypothetical protein [Fulvimonas soli]